MVAKIMSSVSSVSPDTAVSVLRVNYLIGGIVAFLILGYLIYILLRPEKF